MRRALRLKKRKVLSWRRKEAIEQLLRISRGREFQKVGAATEKPLEPKQVRTRGTHSNDDSETRLSKSRLSDDSKFFFLNTVLLFSKCIYLESA